jgi:hypothetical protein
MDEDYEVWDEEILPATDPPVIEGKSNAAELMADWFVHSYWFAEYVSRDGVGFYIGGDPSEARDELADAFPHASDELISDAISLIGDEFETDADGQEWAPSGWRVRPIFGNEYRERELLAAVGEAVREAGALGSSSRKIAATLRTLAAEVESGGS